MVVPMYYCDRQLDGVLHAIAEVRTNINTTYAQFRKLRQKAAACCDAARKMYRELELEVDPDHRADMAAFVDERKAK